ncbi:SDR family oxidoreductase [Paenibacillus herberti]|uniref:Oxidoreductase n=1 Tax=Paenibacillus herberti TaxID=1619309 RepID=A0A229NXW5_9BACL|nr:SDR family oxidoreductase [Paenibacillus herberti]OXM14866.1 oxidoreductase [Paenibacillus herberti]
MHSLKNKRVIVTGVSRETGIGTAICRSLASFGAAIFFTHWRPFDGQEGNGRQDDWPEQLCAELTASGVKAAHMEADFLDPATPSRILDQAQGTIGAPTILIHNACYCAPTNFRDLTQESLDRHYIINNRGPILLSTEFAKRFETSQAAGTPGRILFLVSKGPDAENLAYLATKRTLVGLIEPLAAGLAPLQITVNGIDPGPTDSGWITEEMGTQFLPMFPMGRIGRPDDAAKAITFLASDESQWITGQVILSEGGFLGR